DRGAGHQFGGGLALGLLPPLGVAQPGPQRRPVALAVELLPELLLTQEVGFGHHADDVPVVVHDRDGADATGDERFGDVLERGGGGALEGRKSPSGLPSGSAAWSWGGSRRRRGRPPAVRRTPYARRHRGGR